MQASFSSQQLHYDTLKAELEAKNVQLRDREAERVHRETYRGLELCAVQVLFHAWEAHVVRRGVSG